MNEKLLPFLDNQHRVLRWPKKKDDKYLVLKYLQSKFDSTVKYSEIEVNRILMKWNTFNDHALLRREMYNNYLLNRTNDCKEYWVNDDCSNMEIL